MKDQIIGWLVLGIFILAIVLIGVQNHELNIENMQRTQLLKVINNLVGNKYGNNDQTR